MKRLRYWIRYAWLVVCHPVRFVRFVRRMWSHRKWLTPLGASVLDGYALASQGDAGTTTLREMGATMQAMRAGFKEGPHDTE